MVVRGVGGYDLIFERFVVVVSTCGLVCFWVFMILVSCCVVSFAFVAWCGGFWFKLVLVYAFAQVLTCLGSFGLAKCLSGFGRDVCWFGCWLVWLVIVGFV